ncbi:glycerol dehydratase reactivase beta/small subunit family protein [Pseudonocardia sp. WMMC193]|uniref:glycerol dehydratase reactivase beta/small subunit family protein n=1 Tax=Pseudonocardia sp. WMMC193 TaxID=2911965 RepID=UPI001F407B47|nr:glycerol dehydratase reactivase beta/small subunit family protein [Pseudonocardia sp. WMMC193]MCF7550418.1 glycerol dehydratase reactivase beta/small subunit family protein [Pseudonocardia sp. WMMC193]
MVASVEPPAIVIRGAGPLLREVCAGAEEEGVPVTVEPGTGDATTSAHRAALASALEVGIGIEGDEIVVHHASLPRDHPAEVTGDGRRAGRTAARIVKVLPLRDL